VWVVAMRLWPDGVRRGARARGRMGVRVGSREVARLGAGGGGIPPKGVTRPGQGNTAPHHTPHPLEGVTLPGPGNTMPNPPTPPDADEGHACPRRATAPKPNTRRGETAVLGVYPGPTAGGGGLPGTR